MMSARNRGWIRQAYDAVDDEQLDRGLNWYGVAYWEIANSPTLASLSVEQAIGVVAVLSPQVSWEVNVAQAEMLVAQGYATQGFRANHAKAQRIVDGEPVLRVLSGPKVRAFFYAIRDYAEYNEAVIDRHSIGVWLGHQASEVELRKYCRQPQVTLIQQDFRLVAEEVGVYPHQLQAVTWVWYREVGYGDA